MIVLWLAAGALAVLVALALVRPLLARTAPDAAARLDFDLAIYRDQLAELERAVAAGEVGRAEAEAGRVEIERRILAAGDRPETAAAAGGGRAVLAVALTLLVPLGAFGLYAWHGAPSLPAQPLAGREIKAERDAGSLETAIGDLARRLQERPDDPPGWELLGRSLVQAGRPGEAAEAYRHLIAIAGGRPELFAALGEALTLAADGIVTPAAREAFAKAPGDPRARFFMAEAAAQSGDLDGALRGWTALEADSAADAPWRPLLRRRIAETAAARGVPVPPPAAAAGAAAGDPAAGILRLPPDEQARAIRAMVEGLAQRLEADPDDKAGWQRLAQAWRVLGEHGKAVDALTVAVARFPDDVALRLALGTAQLEAAGGDATLPTAFLETMRAAARLAPDHPQVLWYLGRAAAEGGKPAEARRLWRRLLDRLPADSPARAEVSDRLAALPEDSSPTQ
ncbi:MAG: c-type cytochrome biogenesis protein CcmI [Alphaproteobacteria bacterium]|nr:c-type cytochrome biogenesis protein CcmI [Alphaproteobacteria bacterium]